MRADSLVRPAGSSTIAPTPCRAANRRLSAGASTTPRIGAPSSIRKDVDRELPVAVDELRGRIERVHEPETAGSRSIAATVGGLLGHDRHPRRKARQVRADDFLGPLVGFGHRRAVLLGACDESVLVHFEHFFAGGASDLDDPSRIASPTVNRGPGCGGGGVRRGSPRPPPPPRCASCRCEARVFPAARSASRSQ